MPEEEKMDTSQDRVALEFKEDEFMTNYEGYWIQKSRVRLVNGIYHKYYRKVAANKQLKTDSERRTKLERLMKTLLRNEYRMLKVAIIKKEKKLQNDRSKSAVPEEEISKKPVHKDKPAKEPVCKDNLLKAVAQEGDSSEKTVDEDELSKKLVPMDHFQEKRLPKDGVTKKPGKYLGINYKDDPDIIQYEGFYIHKRSKDRLDKLKEELTQKGLSAEDLRKTLRMECRKEERLVKREKKPKVLQPSTPVQPKTYVNSRSFPQNKFFLHSKPNMSPRINPKKPIINTGVKPKLHKTFDG